MHAGELFAKLEAATEPGPDGVALECVIATPKLGSRCAAATTPRTHLQVSQSGVRASPQGDMPFRATLGDWRDVGGVKIPFESNTQLGPITTVDRVLSVTFDEPMDDKMFDPPKPGQPRSSAVARKVILCRCEDVTLADVQHAVRLGYTDVEEVKRYTGFGTGPCQGKECLRGIVAAIAAAAGRDPATLAPFTSRPPLVPTELAILAGGARRRAARARRSARDRRRRHRDRRRRRDGAGARVQPGERPARAGGKRIVVVDGHYLAWGASGRNGGGVRQQWSTRDERAPDAGVDGHLRALRQADAHQRLDAAGRLPVPRPHAGGGAPPGTQRRACRTAAAWRRR